MKKQTKWSLVAIVGLIIGGVMIFSFQKKEQTFEEQIQHEQERMALYLMNHYEGINEIEFNDIENNASTGSRSALLTINKEFKMEIAFFKFNDKTDNYVISWDKRLNLQEKNETTNQQTIGNIRVKYWGK